MVKQLALPPYFGGKRKLSDTILNLVDPGSRLVDCMGGAMNVAYAAKTRGLDVVANDRMTGPWIVGKAFIENNTSTIDLSTLDSLLEPTQETFIQDNFTDVHLPLELARIADNIRGNIDEDSFVYLALLYNFLTYVAPFNMFRYKAFVNHYNEGKELSKSLQLYADKWTKTINDPISLLHKLATRINNTVTSGTGVVYNKDVFTFLDEYNEGGTLYFDPPYFGARVKYEQGYQVIDEMMNRQMGGTPVSLFNNRDEEREALKKVFAHANKFDQIIFSYWTKIHAREWFECLFDELNLHFEEIPLNGYKYSLSGYIGGTGETSGTINDKVDDVEVLYRLSNNPIEHQAPATLEAFL